MKGYAMRESTDKAIKKEEIRRPQVAFNVYLGGVIIDTVFYNEGFTCEEVKRSLIDHDCYNPAIRVIKER